MVSRAKRPACATACALAAYGTSATAALNDGYHLAFWIAAGLVAAAIAAAVAVLRPGD